MVVAAVVVALRVEKEHEDNMVYTFVAEVGSDASYVDKNALVVVVDDDVVVSYAMVDYDILQLLVVVVVDTVAYREEDVHIPVVDDEDGGECA